MNRGNEVAARAEGGVTGASGPEDIHPVARMPVEWQEVIAKLGERAYRAEQIFRAIHARGVLDPATSTTVGLVVQTQCTYFRSITFPDRVQVGLRVEHLGTSSVRYALGVFCNDDPVAVAEGRFVHVYVDRASQRPVPVPGEVRAVLEALRA